MPACKWCFHSRVVCAPPGEGAYTFPFLCATWRKRFYFSSVYAPLGVGIFFLLTFWPTFDRSSAPFSFKRGANCSPSLFMWRGSLREVRACWSHFPCPIPCFEGLPSSPPCRSHDLWAVRSVPLFVSSFWWVGMTDRAVECGECLLLMDLTFPAFVEPLGSVWDKNQAQMPHFPFLPILRVDPFLGHSWSFRVLDVC